jgi:hypothetical protein
MEQIESGILDKERDNEEIRTILQNLQDYALGNRLHGIKELLYFSPATESFGMVMRALRNCRCAGSAENGEGFRM